MKKLTLGEYRDKLMGCWIGKNVGGVLGAPLECHRGVFDLDYYTWDFSKGLVPNDDLDLQLVWLMALEEYGKNLNAALLSEYWTTYIVAYWNDYGIGKRNLQIGLMPPLSGMVSLYKDGCGSFIRTEIFACVAPGYPELAARLAYEDVIITNSDEGVYGAIFCAVVESAAFVESDKFKLIEIGLSYIPDDCAIAKGVRCALKAHATGKTWQEARVDVMTEVPGTFGLQIRDFGNVSEDVPVGKKGWDTPSNIGLMIIGWLYGEDDFGKSLCITVNCGEDTDCTGATLGSILGIISGAKNLPPKWVEPLGDKFKTLCLDLTTEGMEDFILEFDYKNMAKRPKEKTIPKDITELVERIIKLTPKMLSGDAIDYESDEKGYILNLLEGDDLLMTPKSINYWLSDNYLEEMVENLKAIRYETPIYNLFVDYNDGPFIKSGDAKKIRLTFANKIPQQQWLKLKILAPEHIEVQPMHEMMVFLDLPVHGKSRVELSFWIEKVVNCQEDIIISVESQGRPTKLLVPVKFIAGTYQQNIVNLKEEREKK